MTPDPDAQLVRVTIERLSAQKDHPVPDDTARMTVRMLDGTELVIQMSLCEWSRLAFGRCVDGWMTVGVPVKELA